MVEAAVCRFSEGLPKEADDANMVEAVQEAEVFRAEFVLPAPPKGEDADAAAEAGALGTPQASEGEVAGAAGTARTSQQVVSALEELDDSDAEPESKSGSTYDEAGNRYPNKPLRIWRTRRDRTVWMKELRRAELAENLPGLVFCCAALLDRSRPMQVLYNFLSYHCYGCTLLLDSCVLLMLLAVVACWATLSARRQLSKDHFVNGGLCF